MEKISHKVQSELRNQGKKQKELAEHLGLSEGGLSQLLTRGTFNRDYMIKIAEFLKVDMSFFSKNSLPVSREPSAAYGSQSNEEMIRTLREIIESKDEVIRAKDDLIKAKDAEIASLKLKKT